MEMPTDYLVIGTGVAGMWFALQAAKHGQVTMVTKTNSKESNSQLAQGGIAAVWQDDDSFENHINDTMMAGAGLCRREAVEQTVREGPARVRDLIEFGAKFTRSESDPAAYDLHREGGHSHRRILHADDLTGAEIVRALYEACINAPNICLLQHHMAIDLVTERWLARRNGQIPPEEDYIHGAYILDLRTHEVVVFPAKTVVLATGGAGKVYFFTTNPPIASGDGLAMAYRAGALMANMEFVQFHPTCLFHQKEHSFLISEALRGEGGKLVLPDGHRFMSEYDEREELAPRDIVARAIDAELKKRGLECLGLDMTHLDRESIQHKFPNINQKLLSLGIDMAAEPIPVVPAAHYMCGGVRTDLNGESNIRNLFVVGETACTGLHGANRLASNSLLEALVFAHRAAAMCATRPKSKVESVSLPPWNECSAVSSDEAVVIRHTWEEIRRFMWSYVGIVRTHRRLKRARRRIQLVKEEVNAYYWDFKVTGDLIELRNLATVAEMIVTSALKRRESRGLHSTLDFPDKDDRFLRDTLIQRPEL
ncbi:MAG: L-aspartate oxidase [Proteobacteria bacterium]|nr:L-aspartate oxidase [Pseudomonadota bacterium]